MEQNRYGRLAALAYEVDKPAGHSFGDVEFYRDALADVAGPVLEPAVGSGRILVPLLQAGVAVEGFDASAEMLLHCRKACEAAGHSPRLWQDRFESFQVEPGSYDAVIVPVESFQLVTDFDAAIDVLKKFRMCLKPGGKLVIDIGTLASFFSPAHRARSWDIEGDQRITLVETPTGQDDVRQIAQWQLRYELWHGGKLVDSELDLFALRWWGLEEFKMALAEAGLRTTAVHGDYVRGAAPATGHGTLTFEALAAD